MAERVRFGRDSIKTDIALACLFLFFIGGYSAGFPFISAGKITLAVKTKLYCDRRHTFFILKEFGSGLHFEFDQILMDADSRKLLKNAFNSCFADVAEPGYF